MATRRARGGLPLARMAEDAGPAPGAEVEQAPRSPKAASTVHQFCATHGGAAAALRRYIATFAEVRARA